MAFPVRTCALVGRFSDVRVAESAGALLPHLAAAGVTVLVSEDARLTLLQRHARRPRRSSARAPTS